MNGTFGIIRVSRLVVVALSAITMTFAQMGGNGNGMMSSLGGMMGGSLSGMMGGGSGLTFGPDGTLYLTRSGVQGQGQTTKSATTQLAALDPNGNVKWTLPINTSTASQPVLGKDGTLFVTTSDWLGWMFDWMFNWFYNASAPTAGGAPNLLVVQPGATMATVVATVVLNGEVASAPQIASDGASGYLVYVVTVDAFSGMGSNSNSSSGSYLNVFSPNGALKYRMPLSQGGGMGMMGF